jgi:hypothetical protein
LLIKSLIFCIHHIPNLGKANVPGKCSSAFLH